MGRGSGGDGADERGEIVANAGMIEAEAGGRLRSDARTLIADEAGVRYRVPTHSGAASA